ncbi:DNA-directed RNA polymerase III subunit 2-like protein [Drosera capensis]
MRVDFVVVQVILVQEQLSNNRIIIDINKKGNLIASVTSSTAVLKSKTVVVMEKEKIYLELNKFNGKIPIMVIMKAMGMECNQEVIQMVGSDPCFISLLLPSIEDSVNLGIYSRQQALEFLESKVKRSRFQSPTAQEPEAIRVLSEIFLAHVPVQKNNLRPKCVYTAVMLKRLLEAYLNKDSVDDKDYVGNKRFELSGQLISILFEDLFKSLITSTAQSIENCLKTKRSSQLDVVKASVV